LIASTVPPSSAIDARQPHPITDSAQAQGWSEVTINFDCPIGEVPAGDFAICVDPPDLQPPMITNLLIDDNTAILTLDRPTPAGHWTQIAHLPPGTSVRIGYLPGDVDNNRTASAVDILRLIDHLNGSQSYAEYQTDSDRSGATTPSDILRLIDLLNGAGPFAPWMGSSLPLQVKPSQF
jgi:hypothetical protein